MKYTIEIAYSVYLNGCHKMVQLLYRICCIMGNIFITYTKILFKTSFYHIAVDYFSVENYPQCITVCDGKKWYVWTIIIITVLCIHSIYFRLEDLLKCLWLMTRKSITWLWRECRQRLLRNLFRDQALVFFAVESPDVGMIW